MKKQRINPLIAFALILILISGFVQAQVPQGIPYQAVARNGVGQPLANLPIKVRFSILDSTLNGPAVYSETHAPITSALGLFSVNVGMGNPSQGTFSGINWGVNAKFLKVELDTSASGLNYIDLGTQQMMSVPYAFFAGSANNLINLNGNGSSLNSELVNFSSMTLIQSSHTVPVGEAWKIVSINVNPIFNPVTVTIPFFEPVINGCRYSFPLGVSYLVLRINDMEYRAGLPYSFSNSSFYTVNYNCGGGPCNNCPPTESISFTPTTSNLSSIVLPLWLSEGQELIISSGIYVSVEKYH